MPKAHSATYFRKINVTSADESPLILLEINHPGFSVPIRVLNDSQDLVSNGATFLGCAFRFTPPYDREGQLPRARLAIDNVGRELVAPLEDSGGGEGATIRVMEVLRSLPNTIEWETTLDLKNVEMTGMEVSAELGYEDILNQPAAAVTYRPDVAPGLF